MHRASTSVYHSRNASNSLRAKREIHRAPSIEMQCGLWVAVLLYVPQKSVHDTELMILTNWLGVDSVERYKVTEQ